MIYKNNSVQLSAFRVSLILMALVGLFLFTYLAIAANMARNGYYAEELQKRIVSAEKEATLLQIKLSQVSSLSNVMDGSTALLYTEIKNVSYINKPGVSPFAAR